MKENLALLLAVLYLIYRFKTYRKTNNTYLFVDAGGLKGIFSIDQNYNLLTLVYNDVDLLALEQI